MWFQVVIDRHPVRFFVHKRPHVDFFLDMVSRYSGVKNDMDATRYYISNSTSNVDVKE